MINQNQEIIAILKSEANDDLSDLISENDGISTSNDAEANEKQVNEMYMRICFDGSYQLDTLDWDTLYSIANQCPETGGRAVYEARSLLLLANEFIDFDDETLCDPPAPKPLSQKEAIAGDLLVYPNPFHDEFTVQFIGENTKRRNINLIGIDGRIIAQYILPNGQNKLIINTNSLMSGLYFIRMTSDDGIKIQKLIKQ
ncbi:MAG TPA: T9SS type A sorting domain-containing protein [Saprospiraceae bacterium]|nr:T9SS type A sorting domain-containing protein [Saprospiraceae bacterium]